MVICNVDRFLAEAINSVLCQTFGDFEFIIVDFGSSDNSRPIVEQYAANDERVRFREIPHCGLAEARNAACSLARGKYLAVMDADDVCLPNRFAAEVRYMEEHPDVGVLGAATEWIDAAGREWGVHPVPTEDEEIRLAFAVYHPFYHPTLMIRRELFTSVGCYRAAFAPAEDYDLTLRLSEHCRCANLEEVALQYRIHASQLSLQKRRQQTFGKLGAQASAQMRRTGNKDLLDAAEDITPSVLAQCGVSHARQQSEIALDAYQWIRNRCAVGEYSLAINAIRELLQSDLEHVERWLVADLWLLNARLHWKLGFFVTGCCAAARAFGVRPIVIGRPVKRMLQRIQFPNQRQLLSPGGRG
jgi:hypothetical protein